MKVPLLLALLLALTATLGCGDDDDDSSHNAGQAADDDGATDDDAIDDDAADDDDDNDDDDDEEPTQLYGPVDISGNGNDEYLYVAWTKTGSWPGQIWTYTIEVRDKSAKDAVWSTVEELTDGSLVFALADLDLDGVYEIVETTAYTSPYGGQTRVRDSESGFEPIFDTGRLDDVTFWAEGDWDINADGRPELMIKASPSYGVGANGWVRWYDPGDGYLQIKALEGGVDCYLDVYVGSAGGLKAPADIAGAAEYLFVEQWYSGEAPNLVYHYNAEVRAAQSDALRWSDQYAIENGYMSFALADLYGDGRRQLVATTNRWTTAGDATSYSGELSVRDGHQDFAEIFSLPPADGVALSAAGGWDIDRNGAPELYVKATPPELGVGWLRWYDAGADFAAVEDIALGPGYEGVACARSRDGLYGPVAMGASAPAFLLVRVTDIGDPAEQQHRFDLEVRPQGGGDALWTDTQQLVGWASFALADVDADGQFEIVEAFNLQDWEDEVVQGRVDVRDGAAGFATIFDTQALDDVSLTASPDWDIDRDLSPELAIAATPATWSTEPYWQKWHAGPADFALTKEVAAPAGAAGLKILGAWR